MSSRRPCLKHPTHPSTLVGVCAVCLKECLADWLQQQPQLAPGDDDKEDEEGECTEAERGNEHQDKVYSSAMDGNPKSDVRIGQRSDEMVDRSGCDDINVFNSSEAKIGFAPDVAIPDDGNGKVEDAVPPCLHVVSQGTDAFEEEGDSWLRTKNATLEPWNQNSEHSSSRSFFTPAENTTDSPSSTSLSQFAIHRRLAVQEGVIPPEEKICLAILLNRDYTASRPRLAAQNPSAFPVAPGNILDDNVEAEQSNRPTPLKSRSQCSRTTRHLQCFTSLCNCHRKRSSGKSGLLFMCWDVDVGRPSPWEEIRSSSTWDMPKSDPGGQTDSSCADSVLGDFIPITRGLARVREEAELESELYPQPCKPTSMKVRAFHYLQRDAAIQPLSAYGRPVREDQRPTGKKAFKHKLWGRIWMHARYGPLCLRTKQKHQHKQKAGNAAVGKDGPSSVVVTCSASNAECNPKTQDRTDGHHKHEAWDAYYGSSLRSMHNYSGPLLQHRDRHSPRVNESGGLRYGSSPLSSTHSGLLRFHLIPVRSASPRSRSRHRRRKHKSSG